EARTLGAEDAWASRLRIPRVVGTKPVRGCGGSRRPPPPSKWRSWQVEATVHTRPRLVDGQNAAGPAFSRRSSTNPGQLAPTNFRLWVSGPGGMTEHHHLESAARQTAAQDRRHDRGGGDGGLGARPPPRSTPPPRQRCGVGG